eukprot:575729-Rhodomonas_salina.1
MEKDSREVYPPHLILSCGVQSNGAAPPAQNGAHDGAQNGAQNGTQNGTAEDNLRVRIKICSCDAFGPSVSLGWIQTAPVSIPISLSRDSAV